MIIVYFANNNCIHIFRKHRVIKHLSFQYKHNL